MKSVDRRSFLQRSVLGAAAWAAVDRSIASAEAATRQSAPSAPVQRLGIIDTNVNLFDWPFRALKYRDTKALVAKLKRHRIIEAWAGSFEALFSKDVSGVNARLAAGCRQHGPGFLIPFGTVNLAWPDWEEDVRRCHEIHRMPGLRIYPGYQPFDLDHSGLRRLLTMTVERGLILQVACGMEDPRVHHPIINVAPVTLGGFMKAVSETPGVKVQLLHFSGSTPGYDFARFLRDTNTVIDISRLEGNGAVGRMIGAITGLPSVRVPVDRILFGSHAPFFPVETALLKLIESPLDPQQLRAIMLDNARRILPRG